jgi:hypothetical protein
VCELENLAFLRQKQDANSTDALSLFTASVSLPHEAGLYQLDVVILPFYGLVNRSRSTY